MTFESRLKDGFNQMLAYRTATGYATATYKSSISPFIDYCASNYPDAQWITGKMVDQWLLSYPYSNNGRAVFISLLREYTKFLCFLGFNDFIPNDEYSVRRIAYSPFLFTDEELRTLFDAIDNYQGNTCGKRLLPELVLPVYSRFLYCCGMRPNEPSAMKKKDVDLNSGDVYIRQTKRHKDRHILLSEDMRKLCIKYDNLMGDRDWFFQKWDGNPYSVSWYYQLFNRICSACGLNDHGNPRPYDLRHAFASRNIIRWMESGKDVMELIPYLSAYMGHSELTSTLYYIHLLPEKLRYSTKIDWAGLQEIYGKAVLEDED